MLTSLENTQRHAFTSPLPRDTTFAEPTATIASSSNRQIHRSAKVVPLQTPVTFYRQNTATTPQKRLPEEFCELFDASMNIEPEDSEDSRDSEFEMQDDDDSSQDEAESIEDGTHVAEAVEEIEDHELRSQERVPIVPFNPNEDDASDFYPSDANDERPTRTGITRSTINRYQSRMQLLLNWWKAAGIIEVQMGFFWLVKLSKINAETGRWTPKGPVLLVLHHGDHRGGPVLFAHYMYGTKSSAFSMRLWEHFHHFAQSNGKVFIFSTAGHLGIPEPSQRHIRIPLQHISRAQLDPETASLPVTLVETDVKLVPEPEGESTVFSMKFLSVQDKENFTAQLRNMLIMLKKAKFEERLFSFSQFPTYLAALSDQQKAQMAELGFMCSQEHPAPADPTIRCTCCGFKLPSLNDISAHPPSCYFNRPTF